MPASFPSWSLGNPFLQILDDFDRRRVHPRGNAQVNGGVIDERHHTGEPLQRMLPATAGCAIDHAWSGVLGVTRDWCPSVGADPSTGVAWAGGYAGQGVAAANLAGRTLRDLLLGERTALTDLPWVLVRPRRAWEPEPLRWAGVRGVYALYRQADRNERRSGRPADRSSPGYLMS